jgi:hypothetical protein
LVAKGDLTRIRSEAEQPRLGGVHGGNGIVTRGQGIDQAQGVVTEGVGAGIAVWVGVAVDADADVGQGLGLGVTDKAGDGGTRLIGHQGVTTVLVLVPIGHAIAIGV